MPEGSEARLGLSEYLVQLAAELSKARRQAEKGNLSYEVDEVTLELDVELTIPPAANPPARVKPEFWVVQSGSRNPEEGPGLARGRVQHLILRLTHRLEEADSAKSEHAGPISHLPDERPADTKK